VALADDLAVVAPVVCVPVEVHVDAVLEGGPRDHAGVGGGCVDGERAGGGPGAVVEPVASALGAFRVGARRVESLGGAAPDVDGSVEAGGVGRAHEDWQRAAGPGVALDVGRDGADAAVLR